MPLSCPNTSLKNPTTVKREVPVINHCFGTWHKLCSLSRDGGMIWGIQWLEDSCCREGETYWLQIQSSAIKALRLSTGIHSCPSFVITKQNETHCTHGVPGVLAKGPPVLASVLPKSSINQPLACIQAFCCCWFCKWCHKTNINSNRRLGTG